MSEFAVQDLHLELLIRFSFEGWSSVVLMCVSVLNGVCVNWSRDGVFISVLACGRRRSGGGMNVSVSEV
jgi:hypothetical protein